MNKLIYAIKYYGKKMDITQITASTEQAEAMADLTCVLARTCNDKENYFASMFNLTPAEFKCLRLFTNKEFLPIKEISSKMNITAGRITHILTSLEQKGFVKRRINQEDKRNVVVYLTVKSEPFIRNLNESHIQLHKDILNRIDVSKRDLVIQAMGEVIRALKSWSDSTAQQYEK